MYLHSLITQTSLFSSLPFALIIFFSVAIIFFMYQRCKISKENLRSIKKFPRVKWTCTRLPILDGYISFVKLTGGLKYLEELSRIYGKAFFIPHAYTESLFVTDLDIIEKLLKSSDPTHLNKIRRIYDKIFPSHLRNALVPADAEVWSPHRKAISRAFTYKSFPIYFKIINERAIALNQVSCAMASRNFENTIPGPVMQQLINTFTVKISADIIVGSEKVDTVSEHEKLDFLEDFKRIKEIYIERFAKPYLFLAPIWWFHPIRKELDQATQRLRNFCVKLAQGYRQQKSLQLNDEQVGCPIEEMIKADFSDSEIADEVEMLMAAGNETILMSIFLAIVHLAGNVQHQQKCHEEVDKFFHSRSGIPHESLKMTDFSELKYLERCILETLRLTPAIPFLGRRVTSPVVVSKDVCIPAGTNVMISPWVVHRDPDTYPNPAVFNPDRFLPKNIKQRHPCSYIPFSLGVRNCIGWKVAMLELRVIMTWLLKDFEFSTTKYSDDIQANFGLEVKPDIENSVVIKRRGANTCS